MGHAAGKDIPNYKIAFDEATKNLMTRARVLSENFDFSDLILVSTTGQVVFALVDEHTTSPVLGKNLTNGSLKNSRLGDCYKQALAAKVGTIIYSGYEVSSLNNTVKGFLCSPKFAEYDHLADGIKKSDLMGVIVAELDLDKINKATLEIKGLGKTGVAYLVGPDKRLRSDYSKATQKYTINDSFKDGSAKLSKAIDLVTSGQKGTLADDNLFGESVVSYYSNINFFEQNWGVVVEKEASEIFAPVNSMMLIIFIVSIAITAVVSFFVYTYVSKVIGPLITITESLGQASKTIADSSAVMTDSSLKMSESAISASSSLQQTVSSLDEISSMISINSKMRVNLLICPKRIANLPK
jgi:methyl-accepting chemotaxis protein